MSAAALLRDNLLAPAPLAFALGLLARGVRSEFSLPRDAYVTLSTYLLLALGLKGGVALSQAPLASLAAPLAVTLLIGCATPLVTYAVMRRGGLSVPDAAGMAAHYGSVSAVTFVAAQEFVARIDRPAEPFMTTLLAVLEVPGIQIALGLGALRAAGARRPPGEVLHEVLTGRTMVLLAGGVGIGWIIGADGYGPVAPFFQGLFTGALTLFLLEMGVQAGARLGDVRRAGWFLTGFAVLAPLGFGALGVGLGTMAGLSAGGAAVLGAMAASASYIAAPPAVRLSLPEANPSLSLTCALGITFPFNLLVGIPLYAELAMLME